MSYHSVTQGSLLVVHPAHQQGIFSKSVVLILDHSNHSTHGVILNHCTPVPVSDVLAVRCQNWHSSQLVFLGGPVFQHSLFLLHSTDCSSASTKWVADDLCVTVGADAITLLSKQQPVHWRLFRGLSCWGPGQLHEEFGRGALNPRCGWLTCDCPGAAWIFEHNWSLLYASALSVSSQQAVQNWL